jgi:hypothetical protein
VYVKLQVAEAVLPARIHEPLNVPVLLVVSANVPVGVMKVPGDVSATVMLQVEAEPTLTGEVQLIVVVVARLFTTILAVPLLVECPESPG